MNIDTFKNYKNWSLSIDDDEIVWATFDRENSKVNSLNAEVLQEFEQILNVVAHNNHFKALVIRSGKKTGFIVGADIKQFETISSYDEALTLIKKGQAIFSKLEALDIPTIALIEGMCLGGGLELALACRYRIADNSAKTRIGLPEVKLGIHPGWGGSVRLPKLIGAPAAMQVILSGRAYSAKDAKKMGMIDEAQPLRLLEKTVRVYAQNPPKKHLAAWKKLSNASLVRPALAKLLNYQLSQKVSKAHYPSPFIAIQNWEEVGVEVPAAYDREAESISKLLVSDTSRNLVRTFFLQESLKSLGKNDFKPKHIHVVGAGVMGGDIAAWCAIKGFSVTLQDQAPKLIGNAIKRAFDLTKKQLKEKHLVQAVMDRLMPDPAGLGVEHADVIIEAITEKLSAKQDLFAKLEARAKKEAILATNTSTIPLEEIRTVLQDPQRLVGIHFFNPVAKMLLVEVIMGEDTDQNCINDAMAFVRKIDKLPVPVKSSPGFLVNRILLPYMLEAVEMLEEGIDGALIDKAAVDFGMPMGPIELADAVGLDICLAAMEKLSSHFDGTIPQKLKDLVSRGELGKKTGKGFYQYRKNKVIKPKLHTKASIPQDAINRLTLRLLNEAVACLREEIVESSDLLDAACIFGFGFPPFTGGPITYARKEGKEHFLALLEQLTTRYGKRFRADEGWYSSVA